MPYPGQPAHGAPPTYAGRPTYGGQSPSGGQPPRMGRPPYAGPPYAGRPVPGPQHYPQAARPSRHGLTFGAAAALVAVIALAIALVGSRMDTQRPDATAPLGHSRGSVVQPIDSQTASAALEQAAKAVVPGIVVVDTELGMQNGAGAGTGIVIGSDGTVLTNNHVVEGSTNISVTDMGDGRTYHGTVAGFDRQDDLAVIKLQDASGLQTAPLGDSDKVKVGDSIVGVGNAGGTGSPTAAGGQVSGLDRSITASDESAGASEQLTGLIQVAANIQPGDSGGPLINSSGQVVGVNTAASQGFRLGAGGGQGFAIPIDKAVSIAKQIQAGTASDRVHIGDSAFLGIAMSDAGGSGALVRNVVAGGPAESAGLGTGDVITGLDGHAIDSATSLTNTMDQHHPGDTVTLTWTDQTGQSESGRAGLSQGPVG